MRKVFPLLGLLAVVSAATPSGTGAVAASWDSAIEVPGLAALNKGSAGVVSVSCAAEGDCVAGGFYHDRPHHQQAFVASEDHGVWSDAIEVPGLTRLSTSGGGISSVSCGAPGSCSAVGFYGHGSHRRAFVANEQHGRWTRAIEVPGMAALNLRGGAEVKAVSCATAGNCAAVGSYGREAFVVDEKRGHWRRAIEVPGLVKLNKGHDAEGLTVSCGAAGACVAGGYYNNGHEIDNHIGPYNIEAFVVREQHGRWGNATKVAANLNTAAGGEVSSVSCVAAGACVAGGSYLSLDPLGEDDPAAGAFVLSSNQGRWGKASDVPGPWSDGWQDVEVGSVSCAAAGHCAVGGYFDDGRDVDYSHAFVASETNSQWAEAIEVPGTASVDGGGSAAVNSVSCAAAGCVAGGYYGTGPVHAFLVSETSGGWDQAVAVPGLAALGNKGGSSVNSVSCVAAGPCVAGGTYADGSKHGHAFLVTGTAGP